MTKLLLSLHVLAAILAIGPITVAASMFPRYAKPPADGEGPGEQDSGTAAFLHKICRGYTAVGIAVPVFGVATGAQLGVLTDAWLLASIVLTAVAAALLLMVVLPGQRRLLAQHTAPAAPGTGTGAAPAGNGVAAMRSAAARLAMTTGVFNLLWAAVVVLMIVRPGSTTGA
ncbi:hypothetical protein [Streptomyces sp. BE147]|uniref:hypothetical protein n=1 Tax=unclassified Streptomyces TaxID=2593676 RepID=UPI002E76BAB8|nr:hypothetical protein [Streptomyces sp. BE147]MEE1735218.1 hypothetical protein [Streptomyces sp. BE147]MEE1735239.1 hypothetical protein [Streptomyces sp. BE147]